MVAAAGARAQTAPSGPFTLPPLPYPAAKNEPSIDAETMMLHHDRHHAAYVASLNAAVKDHAQLATLPVQDLIARLHEVPETVRTAIRNNGGGHANHSMFWLIMGGSGGAPRGELLDAINRDLGGMDRFKSEFNRLGLAQFGSGWVFVTVDRSGKLGLVNRPNQDTPLMEGGRVLMGNDVWEHAYYLKYQNRRADYLNAWWNVVNWDAVAARYAHAKAGTLGV
ncbi:MAG TPA: superoxide dismutase [Acetobacteraceae bacterium]|nr:superoxide dismutase [Acetobacteraceae bacterium]